MNRRRRKRQAPRERALHRLIDLRVREAPERGHEEHAGSARRVEEARRLARLAGHRAERFLDEGLGDGSRRVECTGLTARFAVTREAKLVAGEEHLGGRSIEGLDPGVCRSDDLVKGVVGQRRHGCGPTPGPPGLRDDVQRIAGARATPQVVEHRVTEDAFVTEQQRRDDLVDDVVGARLRVGADLQVTLQGTNECAASRIEGPNETLHHACFSATPARRSAPSSAQLIASSTASCTDFSRRSVATPMPSRRKSALRPSR